VHRYTHADLFRRMHEGLPAATVMHAAEKCISVIDRGKQRAKAICRGGIGQAKRDLILINGLPSPVAARRRE
jgi:hypothetical protein